MGSKLENPDANTGDNPDIPVIILKEVFDIEQGVLFFKQGQGIGWLTIKFVELIWGTHPDIP